MTSLIRENNLIENLNMLSINSNYSSTNKNYSSQPPFSPTMKRIVRAEKAKEKRKAFKQSGGKSRSLGNSEALTTAKASSSSRFILIGRSESVNRPSYNNDKKETPKNNSGNISPLFLNIPKANNNNQNNNFTKRKMSDSTNSNQFNINSKRISSQAQQIILSCVEKSRVDPSSRVLNRMVNNRADFATFCINLGEENWTKLADQFRNYLTDVLSNLANTEKIKRLSMQFGAEQVSRRPFGFKADFFAEMASSLTTECVFLDGAAHSPIDTFEAWAQLVELMFSSVRDGYYLFVRKLRRSNFSLGQNSHLITKPSKNTKQINDHFEKSKEKFQNYGGSVSLEI